MIQPDSQQPNPYAPSPPVPDAAVVDQHEPLSLGKTGLRWLFVCSVSALPSFFYGLAATGGQIAGMLTGIVIFVIGYTILDFQTASTPFRKMPTVRRTLMIAYGTRLVISCILPVGAYLDLLCGLYSVSLTESIAGEGLTAAIEGGDPAAFGPTVLATLIQGVALNLIVAAYALVVHVIQLAVLAIIGSRKAA